ncbi:DNA-binding response regulator, partial [Staphylococcus aureus]|nr:DNA-binding response regulator [Staphylococcus aureus]
SGADDYIVKPFSPRDLVLRVKALLRRTQSTTVELSEPHARDVIEFKHLDIDNDAHRVLADNLEVNWTPKEYELVLYLAR